LAPWEGGGEGGGKENGVDLFSLSRARRLLGGGGTEEGGGGERKEEENFILHNLFFPLIDAARGKGEGGRGRGKEGKTESFLSSSIPFFFVREQLGLGEKKGIKKKEKGGGGRRRREILSPRRLFITSYSVFFPPTKYSRDGGKGKEEGRAFS